jgi:23S rRNA (cytosine1962-C5)-methyltransferase
MSPAPFILELKAGKEKPLINRHPWIFSGAVKAVHGDPPPGAAVVVRTDNGDVLGFGAISPDSQIRCRMWAFQNDLPQDLDAAVRDLIYDRLSAAAIARSADPSLRSSDAFRLVFAESDRIPGLIIDRYGDGLVVQLLSAGPEALRAVIVDQLVNLFSPAFIIERSDAEVRVLEGLEPRGGLLAGGLDEGAQQIQIDGIVYQVDLQRGHKTGHYLDQRANHLKLRSYVPGREVLDCFCYTGGFTLNALAAKASSVTSVDTSEEALAGLMDNIRKNDLDASNVRLLQKDVFQQLRLFRDQGASYDVIVLDPPKFAPTRQQVQRASRGYKDINLLAFKLLRPGGILFTFSCSGGVDATLFQQIVAGAALDAGAEIQIIDRMTQASDHPVLTSYPEGDYLKGLVCRKF